MSSRSQWHDWRLIQARREQEERIGMYDRWAAKERALEAEREAQKQREREARLAALDRPPKPRIKAKTPLQSR